MNTTKFQYGREKHERLYKIYEMVVYIMDEKEKQKLEKLNASYKKQNEAIKEKYDRVSVTLPKGTKDRIQARGETVNGYINRLILADLERLENKAPFE